MNCTQTGDKGNASESRPEKISLDRNKRQNGENRRQSSLQNWHANFLQSFLDFFLGGVSARVEVRVGDVRGEVDGEADAADDYREWRGVESYVGQQAGKPEDAGDDGDDRNAYPEWAAPVG